MQTKRTKNGPEIGQYDGHLMALTKAILVVVGMKKLHFNVMHVKVLKIVPGMYSSPSHISEKKRRKRIKK